MRTFSLFLAGVLLAVAGSAMVAGVVRQNGPGSGQVLAAEQDVSPAVLAGRWKVKYEHLGTFGCPANYDPEPPAGFVLKPKELPEIEGIPKEFLAFLGARYEMTAPGKLAGEASLMDLSKLPKPSKGSEEEWSEEESSPKGPSDPLEEPDEECDYSERLGKVLAKFAKLKLEKGPVFMGAMQREGVEEKGMKLIFSYYGRPDPLPLLKGMLVVSDQNEMKCPCMYIYQWEAKKG